MKRLHIALPGFAAGVILNITVIHLRLNTGSQLVPPPSAAGGLSQLLQDHKKLSLRIEAGPIGRAVLFLALRRLMSAATCIRVSL